jgi:hypothetical protein
MPNSKSDDYRAQLLLIRQAIVEKSNLRLDKAVMIQWLEITSSNLRGIQAIAALSLLEKMMT